ncbi:hypothetical protein KILIM_003_01130 [Kineosphaera limosa NBRC 100340]|uniref:Uncharacterized protein n=2 Tax=Kineosphaera TaxID=211469 RepID=K6W4V2_9MICO|nr:hypothetical protein KILIM_003_01130 [Kineosphaera limosa NBRC 100340]
MLLAAAGLGVFHGINPGMGWLFAVSYGLQEKSARAILRTLVPITIGHEASVLPMALAITVFASQVTRAVTLGVFSVGLVAFGIWLLLRRRHFRWVGMRLSVWELAWWSFLMSTVTGAGLMLAPVLLSAPAESMLEHTLASALWAAVVVAVVHALAMMVTAGVVALLVYRVVGLRILRSAWINLDKIWAAAFILAGLFVWLGHG